MENYKEQVLQKTPLLSVFFLLSLVRNMTLHDNSLRRSYATHTLLEYTFVLPIWSEDH